MTERIQLNEPAPFDSCGCGCGCEQEQDMVSPKDHRIQLNEPAPVPGWPLPGEPMGTLESEAPKRQRLDD